jgi:hypothetical protein
MTEPNLGPETGTTDTRDVMRSRKLAPIPAKSKLRSVYSSYVVRSQDNLTLSITFAGPTPKQSAATTAADTDLEWREFLRSLPDSDGVSVASVRAAEQLWVRLRAMNFSLPDAIPTQNGGIFMSWDRDQYHLDITIGSTGFADWFFMDRTTQEYKNEDGILAPALPTATMSKELAAFSRP